MVHMYIYDYNATNSSKQQLWMCLLDFFFLKVGHLLQYMK